MTFEIWDRSASQPCDWRPLNYGVIVTAGIDPSEHWRFRGRAMVDGSSVATDYIGSSIYYWNSRSNEFQAWHGISCTVDVIRIKKKTKKTNKQTNNKKIFNKIYMKWRWTFKLQQLTQLPVYQCVLHYGCMNEIPLQEKCLGWGRATTVIFSVAYQSLRRSEKRRNINLCTCIASFNIPSRTMQVTLYIRSCCMAHHISYKVCLLHSHHLTQPGLVPAACMMLVGSSLAMP